MVEPVFFDTPEYPPALARLYQTIGTGRQGMTGNMALQLTVAPSAQEVHRELWLIELSLEGQTVFAWIDEEAFVEWLAPTLPVPDLTSLAPELYQAAVTHALTPWFDWCISNKLTPPSVKSLSGPRSVAEHEHTEATLFLVEESRWLNLYLGNFPPAWLTALAQTLDTQVAPADQEVVVYGSVGFARINLAELTALTVGDVLMASWQAPLEEGVLLLRVGQALTQVRQIDEGQFKVESIMDPLDDEINTPTDDAAASDTLENAVATLPITLVFEIGRMAVPLSNLCQLRTGDVLEADFKTAPEISIRAQGRIIATASLVKIGDRLGAKINNLIQANTSHDAA